MARLLGSKNKVPQTVKENVVAVFTKLGGTAAMARWATKNQTDFYKLYGRLLPVEGPGPSGEHMIDHKVEVVIVDHTN